MTADDLAPGFAHEQLEGWIAPLADDAERVAALEKAFDYRGDVTLTLADGRTVEGYVFDRRTDAGGPYVRLLAKGSDEKQVVRYAEIAGLAFTGKDTAAGKSFETWVKKYREKKASGERNIGIEAERLDDA